MPADLDALIEDLTRRMDGAMETLRRDFAGLRTGRASPGLLEPVKVEAYGSEVPITQLTAERRTELARAAGRYAEASRVAIRGVRRDGMDQIKAFEKKKEIGEDVVGDWSSDVQKLTDSYIKRIDEALTDKEREIKQV